MIKHSILHSPVALVLLFFVVLIAALGTSRFVHSSGKDTSEKNYVSVNLIGSQSMLQTAPSDRYVARVEAAQRVELGFDISSSITKILKSEGEPFSEGEMLAQLDTRRLQARKNELLASLDRAEALLSLADVSLNRVDGLRKSNSVSAQALDESLRQKRVAQADLNLVRAQLASVELEIEKSAILAPFDGVVVDRLSDVGRTVSLGMPVLIVEQTGQPELRVSVPLDVAKGLSKGDQIPAFYKEEQIQATVDRINLSLSNTRSSELYLSFDARDSATLIPGEILQVELPSSSTEQGVWLPISALTEYGRGLWSVYLAEPVEDDTSEGNGEADKEIVKERDKAELSRTIVLIERIRGDYALVSGGIDESNRDRVVRGSTHRVVDGQVVKIHKEIQVARAPQ
jgi:RND family efflux transporter MFP subunit